MTLTMVASHGGDNVFLKLLSIQQNWSKSYSLLSLPPPNEKQEFVLQYNIYIYLINKETTFDKQYFEDLLDEKSLTFVNMLPDQVFT